MTKVMGTAAFAEACQRVLLDPKTDGYAKAYAKAGLGMTDLQEIKVQSLYILNNLQHWRGDTARMVKEVFRHFSKVGEPEKKSARRSRQSY